MIKVLNIISDTNIGGAGRVLINYIRHSDRRNFELAVALPRDSALMEPLAELGTAIIPVDGIADKSLDLSSIKILRNIIKTVDPDIVHTHGSMAGRIAGRQCGKAVIYTRHSVFPVSGFLKSAPGRFLNRVVNEHYADRIIAVSPAAVTNLVESGISEKKIDVVMNGVEAVERRSLDECAALRRDYGITPEDFVTGIVARIEDYKGHMDILDALRRLLDEGRAVKLIVAGTGAYEDEVRRRATELKLDDAVTFTGFLEDVSPVLSILDVQLNASWGTEATSLALLEGLSMGVPAVISDYGGNPWLIEEGVNGYTFKTRDSAELASRLAALMDDRARLEYLSHGARRIYQERFTADMFARNVESVYMRTLEEKKHER